MNINNNDNIKYAKVAYLCNIISDIEKSLKGLNWAITGSLSYFIQTDGKYFKRNPNDIDIVVFDKKLEINNSC
uniref:hypothetical protein n=1 Tax=Nitratifractor sp. TaxID=2268144 RepID=UPI0025FF7A05